MMNEPILITGCARSGTSLIAGIINLCGAFGGKMSGPTQNNAKGMFENARIRNDIVKPYLKGIQVDRMGQYPLPDIENLPVPTNWRKKIERVIIDEGYTEGAWMYKGAKMCLMWPVWSYAFPNAKWIIVRRRTGDIIDSCLKTGFMRAFSDSLKCRMVKAKDTRDGWLWWVHQHEKRFVEMIEAGVNCKQIWPERMVSGDYGQIYEMLEWLGLEWSSEILSFVDPKLWKARHKLKTQK